MFEVVSQRMFNILCRHKILFRFSKWYKIRQELQPMLYNFVQTIVDKRRNRIPSDSNEPDIFINRVFRAHSNGQFSKTDVYGETSSMVSAGNETVATTISFAILMLAMNQEVQEKLYQEINGIYPKKIFEIDYNDLQYMEYSELVIKETLRLFPAGPFIGRKVTSDLTIGIYNLFIIFFFF